MKWVRWFAVVPSAILAWYVAFIFGLVLVSGVGRLCPPEEVVSGQCGAWWYPYGERAIILFSVGLSAFLVVVCATAVSPTHRVHVAWLAYVSGAVVAVYFVSQTSAVGEFIAAILAGLFGVFCVAKYLGAPLLPNNAFNTDTPKRRAG